MVIFEKIKNALKLIGIDLKQMKSFILGVIPYLKDLYMFNKKIKRENDVYQRNVTLKPMLGDKEASAGSVKGHYVFARHIRIKKSNKQ